MDAQQIDATLAEVAQALAEDQCDPPLTELALQALQRKLVPVREALESEWRQIKPGGPARLRALAIGQGADIEAEADRCRKLRDAVDAQLQVLADRRRQARIREALATLPQAYQHAADAVVAAERAWSEFVAAVDGLSAAAQRVNGLRFNAGAAAPEAPDAADSLPPRVAALARQIADRAHGIGRWPDTVADALAVADASADSRHRLGLYANV